MLGTRGPKAVCFLMKLKALSAQNSTVVVVDSVFFEAVTVAVVPLRPPQETATNNIVNMSAALFISAVEFPGGTVLGVLDFKS